MIKIVNITPHLFFEIIVKNKNRANIMTPKSITMKIFIENKERMSIPETKPKLIE